MLCSALAETNERLLGGLQEDGGGLAGLGGLQEDGGGMAGAATDTAIYLDHGVVVRAHSVVLAAGADHYRCIAQVGTRKELDIIKSKNKKISEIFFLSARFFK
jgi:hypothetical protein